MSELFDSSVYARRISQAALSAAGAGLSGLVIGAGPELAYLTGSWISSHERLTALVIPVGAQPVLVAPAVDKAELKLSALPELDVDLAGWVDGDNPHQLAVNALDHDGPVALGSSLTADHVLKIQELLGGRGTVLATESLKELFMRKDPDEIDQLRQANHAIDAVHAEVPGLLQPGRTEAEVAADLDKLILAEHDAVDFVIVGSGPNGADPHHSFSERTLAAGEPVVVDLGGTYGVGYHSDCTRTYVVGGPETGVDEEFTKLYEVLFRAQEAACAAVRPGVTAESIDRVAREHIEQAGYGEYFIHRTGHGIGLSTHEEPFIMAGNELVLEEGMAFSVEPGIYLPGKFGARIEDILTVTADGAECLTRQPRVLK